MRSQYDWLIYLSCAIGLAVTGAFIVLPALDAVWLSFHQANSFISKPVWVGLDNYARVLADPSFWDAARNGLIYGGTSIVLQVVLGILFALVLNQSFPGRRLARGLIVLPYLLPTVVVALTFQWMMDGSFGLLSVGLRHLGFGTVQWFENPAMAMASAIAISVWMWTPFVTVCVLAGMQSIPQNLYDAAKVDGASAWNRFWHVTIPQLAPVLTVVVLLRGIWMFNKFDIIWLMTKGGPMGATEHLPIQAYKRAFTMFDLGGGTTVATISFLLLSVLVLIYFRLFPLEERR